MSVLRVLSADGDSSTPFAEDDYHEAQRLFERLATSHVAFKLYGPDVAATRIQQFDPTAREIVLVPNATARDFLALRSAGGPAASHL